MDSCDINILFFKIYFRLREDGAFKIRYYKYSIQFDKAFLVIALWTFMTHGYSDTLDLI